MSGRKYVWWESTDEGQTHQKTGTNSRTYTFNAPQVTKTTHIGRFFTTANRFKCDWWQLSNAVGSGPAQCA
ncbi:hypothetical protein WP50_05345 [Lactiplantibacillus plantarum]|nr:hypothetical protein WP50_05345 [Lactiplantibacillus plantarum]